jgi:2-oxo-4-hydroxy-4-carboxy--5-ureidoimidazoline (OHCU) decarboxylase
MALPALCDVLSSTALPGDPLATALAILFEPSPILFTKLVPHLATSLGTVSNDIASYRDIINVAVGIMRNWDNELGSQVIVGHPRIGENRNLSNLSANEQGAGSTSVSVTSPEVLARLAHLNSCYERRYPGLRYITFVNGRSRAVIAEEMEGVLEIGHSLSADEPPVDSFEPVDTKSAAWKLELDRAIVDMGRIAESRLTALGVE